MFEENGKLAKRGFEKHASRKGEGFRDFACGSPSYVGDMSPLEKYTTKWYILSCPQLGLK
jgi:hypothetical protein